MCDDSCRLWQILTGWFDMKEFVPLVVSLILGGVIGIERELSKKPAGLRTNILICMGATAFTLVARHIDSGPEAYTRILQGVITGVGFLGAGALIHQQGGIHGLTTAASIWLVTSVGIACGIGQYSLAITTVILAMVVLLGLHPLTKKLGGDNYPAGNDLQKNPSDG